MLGNRAHLSRRVGRRMSTRQAALADVGGASFDKGPVVELYNIEKDFSHGS
jgi:hypothetical protein